MRILINQRRFNGKEGLSRGSSVGGVGGWVNKWHRKKPKTSELCQKNSWNDLLQKNETIQYTLIFGRIFGFQ